MTNSIKKSNNATENSSALRRIRSRFANDILSAAQVLGYEAADVHRRMAASVGEDRSLVLAPRGFGKSTLLSIVRCVFEIARNPDARILLASNTQPQAEGFIREVRGHLERGALFRAAFGDFIGPKWTDKELIVRPRTRIAKEPSIYAAGVGGAVISRHFDLIICDDIVDEENARTEFQRERLKTWFFKVLLPCLEPDGQLAIVGTRYHYRDLYGHLLETGFAPTTIIRAIEDGQSSWPEKFPLHRLEQIRRDSGTIIFNAQYQNDTEAMKGAVFKEEWLRFCDQPPASLRIYQGVDLSVGSASDFFAVVTIGLDSWGNIYILDCYQARLSFRQQSAAIIDRFMRFNPIRVAIESNAYQAVQADFLRDLGLPRITKAFVSTDKLTRAWKLSALFEDGRVYLSPSMRELTEQLLAFPQCANDDLLDALDLAVSISSSRGPRIRFI
jgi:predicted phage terminase large subunit-like protein